MDDRIAGFARVALVCAAVSVSTPARVEAQTLSPILIAPSLAPLPRVPELRLSWPLRPLRVDFSGTELTGYVAPLALFRFQSVWRDTGRLQLLTATAAERAFELDCRLTCQPVVSHLLELEGRVTLPGLGPSMPSSYVSLRSSSAYTSQSPRSSSLVRATFGGNLNF